MVEVMGYGTLMTLLGVISVLLGILTYPPEVSIAQYLKLPPPKNSRSKEVPGSSSVGI